MLSVRDTLTFAARARVPRNPPGGVSKHVWADHMRDVVMAMFGISHTIDTRVGNEYIRGISGGERKRVTISEATLSGAPLQCWDNSTRGLDSANAIEFCRTLRISTDILRATACVSIYQAPQAAFDCFDKALVLYEGRQIFFGKTTEARQYFEELGFYCPDRQTTADFLTSMTSPQERVVRDGFEGRVPRTPAEFAARWKESQQRAQLMKDIEAYDQKYKMDGEHLEQFKTSRKAQQSRNQYVTRRPVIFANPSGASHPRTPCRTCSRSSSACGDRSSASRAIRASLQSRRFRTPSWPWLSAPCSSTSRTTQTVSSRGAPSCSLPF